MTTTKQKVKQTASDIHSANLRIKILEGLVRDGKVISNIQVGRINRLRTWFLNVGFLIFLFGIAYDPIAERLLIQHSPTIGFGQWIVIGFGIVLFLLGCIL